MTLLGCSCVGVAGQTIANIVADTPGLSENQCIDMCLNYNSKNQQLAVFYDIVVGSLLESKTLGVGCSREKLCSGVAGRNEVKLDKEVVLFWRMLLTWSSMFEHSCVNQLNLLNLFEISCFHACF